MYEWPTHTFGELDAVPDGDENRRELLAGDCLNHLNENTETNVADRFRDELRTRYGEATGAAVKHDEAVEISECDIPLTDETRKRLFFWWPVTKLPRPHAVT